MYNHSIVHITPTYQPHVKSLVFLSVTVSIYEIALSFQQTHCNEENMCQSHNKSSNQLIIQSCSCLRTGRSRHKVRLEGTSRWTHSFQNKIHIQDGAFAHHDCNRPISQGLGPINKHEGDAGQLHGTGNDELVMEGSTRGIKVPTGTKSSLFPVGRSQSKQVEDASECGEGNESLRCNISVRIHDDTCVLVEVK